MFFCQSVDEKVTKKIECMGGASWSMKSGGTMSSQVQIPMETKKALGKLSPYVQSFMGRVTRNL